MFRGKEAKEWMQSRGAEFVRSIGVGAGMHVLDFGAGNGTYSVPLAQVVAPDGLVIAVDTHGRRLRAIREKLPAELKASVETHKTDGAASLPFIEDGSLDAALLFDVLQHVADWEGLFAEMARCLRPGGLLCVNPSELSHPGKVDLVRMERMLAGAGFVPHDTFQARVAHFRHMADERVRTYTAGA